MTTVRTAIMTLVVLVLQVTLFADLRVFGVAADAVLLFTVLAGLLGGSRRGAIVGFSSGLALDLLLATPLGLTALAYCLAGHLSGLLGATDAGSRRRTIALASAATSAAGVVLFAFVAMTVGIDAMFTGRLFAVAITVGALNGLLSLFMRRPVVWSMAGSVTA